MTVTSNMLMTIIALCLAKGPHRQYQKHLVIGSLLLSYACHMNFCHQFHFDLHLVTTHASSIFVDLGMFSRGPNDLNMERKQDNARLGIKSGWPNWPHLVQQTALFGQKIENSARLLLKMAEMSCDR